MPTWPIVIFCDLMESNLQVIIRADPFSGIDLSILECGDNFFSGQEFSFCADFFEDLAAKSWDTDFEAFNLFERFDSFSEPTAHLRAGITSEEGLDIEIGVEAFPEFLSVAVVDPSIHFLRIEAEGDGGKELEGIGF